jgi:hypothetical protein
VLIGEKAADLIRGRTVSRDDPVSLNRRAQ